MTQSKPQKGRKGEELAAQYLEERGLKVMGRNFRCPLGEIDLICKDRNTIVFVEVKSRSSNRFGLPQEAVTPVKQRRLTLLAHWYLKGNGLERQPARFDVIAIAWRAEQPEVTWIVNAFEARG